MRFQIKGLDNVKLSEHARFCIESINILVLYDIVDRVKSLSQTVIRISNLSSLNCFDRHGNGQTDPVIFTAQTHTTQQTIGILAANGPFMNNSPFQVFYKPQPEILYNFPISSNFLNNRFFDFTLIMQFTPGVPYYSIDLLNDQRYFDTFHISFIVYDLDEEELLLTSTQDVDFKKFCETLPRKNYNTR